MSNLSQKPSVAVIIPATRPIPHLYEALEKLHLHCPEGEVIVLPNEEVSLPHCRVIATGPIGPGDKRDIGAKNTEADILAFLDDDAYPTPDWLPSSLPYFEDSHVCAVAGPAVTPNDETFWAKVSGAFYLSPFGGGNTDRYWPGKAVKDVDDWATVNLLVRRSDFFAVGGFQTAFWPGEDTKLCKDLTKGLGKRIVYEPKALVYHHRRSGLKRHLRQVGRYGLHRGFFAKRYPETSRRLSYFVPSAFLLSIVGGLLLLPFSAWPLAAVLGAYAAVCVLSLGIITQRENSIAVAVASIPYFFLSHVAYGWNFLKGLVLTRELKSKLRAA